MVQCKSYGKEITLGRSTEVEEKIKNISAKRIISSVDMKSWTCKKYTFLSFVLSNFILTRNLHLARPGGNSLTLLAMCDPHRKKTEAGTDI